MTLRCKDKKLEKKQKKTNMKIINNQIIYRVSHKGWEFRDDRAEFVQPLLIKWWFPSAFYSKTIFIKDIIFNGII